MKILKDILIIAVIFSTIITTFVGCKKGDGDPFISLHSRKARVAGKWKLTNGTLVYKNTDLSGTIATSTITYDGTKADKSTVIGTGAPTFSSKSYTEEWEFKKDGSFAGSIIDDGEIRTISGVWNFTGGVGNYKKKEQLVRTILSLTVINSMGTSTYTYTGAWNYETYDLHELKNKEMIWKQNKTFSDSGGSSNEIMFEMTYKQ